jgi:hydrogenase small subunit
MGNRNALTRREFLQLAGAGGAGLMGISLLGIPGFNELFAASIAEVPVIWIQGGSCTGCSVSLLNSVSPTIQDLLLGEVVPGKHISMAFHPTVMAGQGDQAIAVLNDYSQRTPGSYVLVVEGSVSTKDDGIYCEVGEKNGHGIPLLKHLQNLAPNAMAVISIGTCSSFGGIPAAPPNPTGIKKVTDVLKEANIATPVVNVPGCPPHPDWFVGTVATILIGGLNALALDEHLRPKAFYGGLIHDNCPFRGYFDDSRFAEDFSSPGCLYALGCRGPETHSDCPHRKWNNGVNWCIGSGSPCIGCVEPGFPYQTSLLNT